MLTVFSQLVLECSRCIGNERAANEIKCSEIQEVAACRTQLCKLFFPYPRTMSQILQSDSNLSSASFEAAALDVEFETALCRERAQKTEFEHSLLVGWGKEWPQVMGKCGRRFGCSSVPRNVGSPPAAWRK